MRIVILGAGYAGVTLVRSLERRLPDRAEIVLIDEHDYHLVQHELHRVVRRPSLAEAITVPLGDVTERAEVRVARVSDVDTEANEVHLADGGLIAYDVCAVCLGAETNFYDLPGVEDHAIPLTRLDDAERIREAFFAAAESDDPRRVVVGGAGLSGVQVAGELAELARENGLAEDGPAHDGAPHDDGVAPVPDDPDADLADPDAWDESDPVANGTGSDEDDGEDDQRDPVEIHLLEQFDRVAPAFDEQFGTAVHEELEKRGVTVRTGVTVDRADADSVTLDTGESIACDGFVWTGGLRGPDAMGGERPETRSDLRVDGDTFVIGDAARVVDEDGQAVPASAQAAIRQARTAADSIVRIVEDEYDDGDPFGPRMARYEFDSPGWLVSVGNGAVAQVGPTVVRGTPALALKASVGAGYLSSVGAVRKAVGLVNEELGIAVGEDC